jgi:hypothetical protein
MLAADDFRTPARAVKATCDCSRFQTELTVAEGIFASRNDDIEMPLTPVMHDRYRARVDGRVRPRDVSRRVRERARADRNRARVLFAQSGFKDASLGVPEWKARLAAILTTMERCLEIDPKEVHC